MLLGIANIVWPSSPVAVLNEPTVWLPLEAYILYTSLAKLNNKCCWLGNVTNHSLKTIVVEKKNHAWPVRIFSFLMF